MGSTNIYWLSVSNGLIYLIHILNCAYVLLNVHYSLKTHARGSGQADEAAHFKQTEVEFLNFMNHTPGNPSHTALSNLHAANFPLILAMSNCRK